MQSKHGALEGVILSSLWELEEKGNTCNTVKDVFDYMLESGEKRAYTTVKTVMDRLTVKKILIKEKRSKKYIYKTVRSNRQVVVDALNEISDKYCFGDIKKLYSILESMVKDECLVGA